MVTDDKDSGLADHPGLAALQVPSPQGRPHVLAHLAQSLDGFIATPDGSSRWISGPVDLDHTHHLRSLVDAVVIGADTACLDDPQLTVRRVAGPNPLRVVIDPTLRTPATGRLCTDGQADTLLLCRAPVAAGRTHHGRAAVLGLAPTAHGHLPAPTILAALAARGVRRVLVEGGGRTISAFLQAGCLDRLHLVVAPVVLGQGRPGLGFLRAGGLAGALRPAVSVHRLGADTLFDCTFSA